MPQQIISQIRQNLAAHSTTIPLIYLGVLGLASMVYLLSLSIQYSDSDLWYHLAGGRYLLEENTLYNPYVNSYLTPAREFINYFWGFQLLSYGTWSLAGETGLIIMKAALFSLSGYLIARIVTTGQPFRDTSFLQLVIITAVVGILCARGFSLRPHVMSYVFIPMFIYILTCKPRWYPALPLLTVAWVNLHGVEWIVGATICGAFFLQHLADWAGDSEKDNQKLKPLIWISLCLPAMFVNPNGLLLLVTPFSHDPGLARFISELQPFALDLTVELNQGISTNALVLLVMGFVVTACAFSLNNPRQYIAALLMALAGLVLLVTAKRFIWEWALLSIPLITACLNQWRGPAFGLASCSALAVFMLSLLLSFWPGMRTGWQHYPYDEHSLPWGTTEFIQKMGVKGKYAIAPSFAGYTEFTLAPDIKIHMDMQFPPFNSGDFHEIQTAMLSAPGLQTYIAKHRPDLFGVSKSNKHFPDAAAKKLGYVPVFFDNKVVLYIDKPKYPDVAKRFELVAINPFTEGEIRASDIDAGISELRKMLALVDTPDVKLVLVGLLMEQRQMDLAANYAAELMLEKPHDVATLYTSARVQHLSDNCAAAVTDYERAIKLTDDPLPMHLLAAECYFVIGEMRAAYRHFDKAINPYKDVNPIALSYYQFALAAIGTGNTAHAQRLLQMILQFSPEHSLRPQIDKLLQQLETAT